MQFWSEIKLVISNRTGAAHVRFWNQAYDFRPNCTPLSSITILIHYHYKSTSLYQNPLPQTLRKDQEVAVILLTRTHCCATILLRYSLSISRVVWENSDMLWSHSPVGSCSHSIARSPKLPLVFLQLDGNLFLKWTQVWNATNSHSILDVKSVLQVQPGRRYWYLGCSFLNI